MFFENFELLADAPGFVERLRTLILRMAVQGRLVQQDPNDQPASQLLRDAVRAREELVEMGTVREEVPDFAFLDRSDSLLPRGWVRAPLSAYVAVIMGQSPPSSAYNDSGNGLPFYQGKAQFGRLHPSATSWCTEPTKIGEPSDVLISVRAPVGPTNILCERSCIGRGLAALRSLGGDQMHLLYTLRAFEQDISALGVGSTFVAISKNDLDTLLIPVPPLAEQKRIVAKVNQLMEQCDRLESQQQERDTRHGALARAALDRFTDAPTTDNLDYLFHDSFSVSPANLRKSILTLAVEGKLVPQDPNDESVDVTLALNDQVRRKKAETDRRADSSSQSLLSSDDRWDIAETWTWRGLADLVLFVDYRGKTPAKVPDGIRLLTAKNVRKGRINLSPEEFLSEREYHEWMTRGFPKTGDVLFTTEAPMGNAAVVRLTERFGLAQRVICFQSYGAIDPDFLVLQLLSDQFQGVLEKNSTGVTAKGIKASKLKQLPIAVPPLAEQRRIVAKVDELMTLVGALEAQVANASATGTSLLSAVVSELTTES